MGILDLLFSPASFPRPSFCVRGVAPVKVHPANLQGLSMSHSFVSMSFGNCLLQSLVGAQTCGKDI